MADPTFFDLFKSTWAQNGLTEDITDLQYKTGWSFIGSVPPSVEQFNKVQQTTDERLAWLYKQLDGLAAVTGRPLAATGFDALSYAQQNLNATNLKTGTVPVARLSGTASTLTAGAAQKLATARTIATTGDATGSASFDGSANASLALTLANSGVAAGSYGDANRIATFSVDAKGRVTAAGTASVGNAASATKLATARAFSITGGATAGGATFDGSGNVVLAVTALDVSKATAGVLTVGRGGTGVDAVAAGSYLMGAGSASLIPRTPAQVFSDIGVSKAITDALTTVGLGTVDSGPNATNLDDPTLASGLYYSTGTVEQGNWVGNGFMLHKVYGNAGFQLSNRYGSGVLRFRERSGGVWLAPITLANLDSPTFTGTPRAVTPTADDKSTRLATTAYVDGSFPRIYSISSLPTTNLGPILVAEAAEVWVWVATEFFSGYRSPLCGRPLDGHTVVPLASEVDATGGLLSKSAYARLWGYAQEQGLVKTESVWSANRGSHWFSDYSATQFRVPDLRDMFRRYTGTDTDTANARVMGSRQSDAVQNVTGRIQARSSAATVGALIGASGVFSYGAKTDATNSAPLAHDGGNTNTDSVSFDLSRVARTSTETRSANVALHPRIHT